MNNLEQSENPRVLKYARLSQVFEILVLIGLVLFLWGFFALDYWLRLVWSLSFISFSIACFYLARKYAAEALTAYRSIKFKITKRRLRTLEAVEVPSDVIECLAERGGRIFKGEGKFFRNLERALGNERTSEVRSTVFKYTKL